MVLPVRWGMRGGGVKVENHPIQHVPVVKNFPVDKRIQDGSHKGGACRVTSMLSGNDRY